MAMAAVVLPLQLGTIRNMSLLSKAAIVLLIIVLAWQIDCCYRRARPVSVTPGRGLSGVVVLVSYVGSVNHRIHPRVLRSVVRMKTQRRHHPIWAVPTIVAVRLHTVRITGCWALILRVSKSVRISRVVGWCVCRVKSSTVII